MSLNLVFVGIGIIIFIVIAYFVIFSHKDDER